MSATNSSRLVKALLCTCISAAVIYTLPNIKIQRKPVMLDWDEEDLENEQEAVHNKEQENKESALNA